MRHYLEIVRPDKTLGDYNEVADIQWKLVEPVRADLIEADQDNEFLLDGEMIIINEAYKIRFTKALKDNDAIRMDGEIYRIVSKRNVKKLNRFYLLYLVKYGG